MAKTLKIISPEQVIDNLEATDKYDLQNKDNAQPNLRVEFPNGYGASLIWDGYGSNEGLVEIAICRGMFGTLLYNTPITDDVIGWLDWDGVLGVLTEIRSLDGPPSPSADEDEEDA